MACTTSLWTVVPYARWLGGGADLFPGRQLLTNISSPLLVHPIHTQLLPTSTGNGTNQFLWPTVTTRALKFIADARIQNDDFHFLKVVIAKA